jgi:hypothetical protein
VAGGVVELIIGGIMGFLASVGVQIPKALADLAAVASHYLFGTDTRPVRMAKGAVDLGLGALALWDVNAHAKDDFWKGVEWVFGVLEAVIGATSIGFALADYARGNPSGKGSLDVEAERAFMGLLTGKSY